MLIGITGQMGVGKSEVARLMAKYGAFVISGDRIGRDIVSNNRSVIRQLVKAFGTEILTPAGKISRRKVAARVFSNRLNLLRLNRIVHPPLLQELTRQVNMAAKKCPLVVIDAALLIDWGWQKKVDFMILVHARPDLRLARLKAKGLKESDIKRRILSQLQYRTLRKKSDFVIRNNGSKRNLDASVKNVLVKVLRKG